MTPRYDVLLKGGRVIDPAARRDGIYDVAVADGRIAAVAADIPRAQPVYQTAQLGKMPIGKTPVGKTPIGKPPVARRAY